MTNFKLKNLKRKYILAIVAVLLISTLLVTTALVVYTSNATATETKQLTLGYAIPAAWIFYVNEVNQIKYMPGNASSGNFTATFSAVDPSTYAFKVVTDADRVCAVQIDLVEAMPTHSQRR